MNNEVLIIGSGPGGYHLALLLAKKNIKVTVVDRGPIGGTCLNVGCIPTKTLLEQASAIELVRDLYFKKKTISSDLIINNFDINLENIRKYQTDVINQLQQGLSKSFIKNKIKFIQGNAKIVGKNEVEVLLEGKKERITADKIVIATGSSPRGIPGFSFDGKFILNSDNVWNVPVIPKNLLVIGSGPIGIEFARVFHSFGSKVTIAEIQEKICPLLDTELSENLVRSLKRRSINFKVNYASKLIDIKDNVVNIQFLSTKEDSNEIQSFDQVLIATGRKPNIENLGLEEIGIELENNTFIKTNTYLQTNIENIWALGDVTNFPQLAHTASFQARVVAKNILGEKKIFNSNLIPSCIFGYPEVAFVGKNEEELKQEQIEFKVGKSLYLASGKAKASGHTEGLIKVLMETKTKKLLGCHIVGAEASSIIHEAVIAMENNISVDCLVKSIHAHPTYSEVFLDALENCLGESVYI